MKTLVLNSGSSSIKYSLFDNLTQRSEIAGLIEKIGESDSRHLYTRHDAMPTEDQLAIANHAHGLQRIFALLTECGALSSLAQLSCIGHRVVHGGEYFRAPQVITPDVIEKIRALIPLAPLHNPANLLGIEQSMQLLPTIVQVAVFDTAFHQSIPEYAYRYAVPTDWYEQYSVRRYGFHGTSHAYVAQQAAAFLAKPLETLNLITLHLGNGASACAINQGKSVDTSMGLTPLEGLIMGTRSGDLDPAILFYLQRQGMSHEQIETALNKLSGLKGICQENDMRGVHQLADQGNASAQLALAMYAYRIKKYIGAYYAALGSVDALIFTGGIGENDFRLRAQCCENLQALGIHIEAERNTPNRAPCYSISSAGSPAPVLVIKTNEELAIATQAQACIDAVKAKPS